MLSKEQERQWVIKVGPSYVTGDLDSLIEWTTKLNEALGFRTLKEAEGLMDVLACLFENTVRCRRRSGFRRPTRKCIACGHLMITRKNGIPCHKRCGVAAGWEPK
jgi:hypothetical protein